MKISTKNQRGRRKRKEVEVGTKEGIFLLHEMGGRSRDSVMVILPVFPGRVFQVY